jgi:SpoVK/Ycf46/Vps4 family AAA+-type ATPase
MHTLQDRKKPVVTLYVKSARNSYNIRSVFQMARAMTPCMLVLEDIDTIVNSSTRSYFFNEVDGLENNDGILMIATTNHLDALDPGLSKRPSRFDRKYLFPLPSKGERSQYGRCSYLLRTM